MKSIQLEGKHLLVRQPLCRSAISLLLYSNIITWCMSLLKTVQVVMVLYLIMPFKQVVEPKSSVRNSV